MWCDVIKSWSWMICHERPVTSPFSWPWPWRRIMAKKSNWFNGFFHATSRLHERNVIFTVSKDEKKDFSYNEDQISDSPDYYRNNKESSKIRSVFVLQKKDKFPSNRYYSCMCGITWFQVFTCDITQTLAESQAMTWLFDDLTWLFLKKLLSAQWLQIFKFCLCYILFQTMKKKCNSLKKQMWIDKDQNDLKDLVYEKVKLNVSESNVFLRFFASFILKRVNFF
jgi:hypothetical protein